MPTRLIIIVELTERADRHLVEGGGWSPHVSLRCASHANSLCVETMRNLTRYQNNVLYRKRQMSPFPTHGSEMS
ncbi:hypothetical protein EYF80_034817 [Liparis tanakae]|uniref:Uncharacterized protein n=1 Tax=Liparis tanakae TaxID=230148 RepID=A0A4Z2GNM2_9TELE|nr:hypothetical protein EYF80_034817 [Liparis tanakae]